MFIKSTSKGDSFTGSEEEEEPFLKGLFLFIYNGDT